MIVSIINTNPINKILKEEKKQNSKKKIKKRKPRKLLVIKNVLQNKSNVNQKL